MIPELCGLNSRWQIRGGFFQEFLKIPRQFIDAFRTLSNYRLRAISSRTLSLSSSVSGESCPRMAAFQVIVSVRFLVRKGFINSPGPAFQQCRNTFQFLGVIPLICGRTNFKSSKPRPFASSPWRASGREIPTPDAIVPGFGTNVNQLVLLITLKV